MTAKKNDEQQKHARYLVNPDTNHVELVHADDVQDRQGKGWEDPEGEMANGVKWNSDEEEAVSQRDAAAKSAKTRDEWQAEKDKKKADEAEAARKEAEKNAPKPEPKADLKVEVVQPPAEPKSKK